MAPLPTPGQVIRYSYLWHRQYLAGQENGEKDRPCAIVLQTKDEEGTPIVTVVPITHTPPADPDTAVELPIAVKKRLGLDDEPSWIMIDEVNRFAWPGPDVVPVPGSPGRFDYGTLPTELFREVQTAVVARYRAKKLKLSPRTE